MKRLLISGFLIFALLLQSFPVQPVAANYQPEIRDMVVAQGTVNDQQSDQPVINTSADTGMVTFIGTSNGTAVDVPGADVSALSASEMSAAALDAYAPKFGVSSPETDLQLLSSDTATETGNYYRYQQTYQGIPVMAGEIIVNVSNEGELVSMSGEASPNLDLPTEPQISADEARSAAQDLMVNRYGADASLLHLSDPQLWIFDERLLMPSTKPAELVWRLEATVEDQPLDVLILVSAVTGGISLQFNQIDTDVTGRTWTQANVNQDDVTPTEIVTAEPEVTDTPVPTEVLPTDEVPTETPTEVPTLEETPVPTEPSEPEVTGQGVIWYVSASVGNDANDCQSVDTPCATIQAAVDKAVAGDTVYVTAETYTSSSKNVVSLSKGLNLIGGWDATFTVRSNYSVLDGQFTRRGIYVHSSTPNRISNFKIINCDATKISSGGSAGGGIEVDYNPNIELTNIQLIDNTARHGGGIYFHNDSIGVLSNLSIHNNHAEYGGGIYFLTPKNIKMLNTTVSLNYATNMGGGIYVWGSASNNGIFSNNSTIVRNTAENNGGGIYLSSTTNRMAIFQNTILSDNLAPQNRNCRKESISNLFSNGYNLFQDVCAQNNDTDIIGKSALVGGVLPSGLMQISPESPAIDKGNPLLPESDPLACAAFDQLGSTRPLDGNNDGVSRCDIGANELSYYEYTQVPTSLTLIKGNNQSSQIGRKFDLPFSVLVTDQNGIPVIGEQVTFSAPVDGPSGVFVDSNSISYTATTDDNGVATSSLYIPNMIVGTYEIKAASEGIENGFNFTVNNIDYWYISTIGNDTNNCLSPNTPCLTLEKIRTLYKTNDTIYVASGDYVETQLLELKLEKPLKLIGGWNPGFTEQSGYSTLSTTNIDYTVLILTTGKSVDKSFIQRFVFKNGKFGLELLGQAQVIVDQCIFTNNSTALVFGVPGLLINSTITNNDAPSGHNNEISTSSGVAASSKDVFIINSAILNNHSVGPNAGIQTPNLDNYIGNIHLQNSIVINNSANGVLPNCNSLFFSEGHNILATDCWVGSADTDLLGVPPNLSDFLNSNFYVPIPGNEIIDKGDCSSLTTILLHDQRGKPRQIDGDGDGISVCDIGPIEYSGGGIGAKYLYPFGGPTRHAVPNEILANPIGAVVLDEDGDGVEGVSITFSIEPSQSGASAKFIQNNDSSITVETNDLGIALAGDLKTNGIWGDFAVSASADEIQNPIEINISTGVNIFVYSMLNTSDDEFLPGQFYCDNSTDNCLDKPDKDAKNAFSFAQDTFEYFSTHHLRMGIDGEGAPILLSVHYGTKYANSFWNGQQAVFGDGEPTDDTVSHELVHGITQNTSNLLYFYQSGAINESLSDMWGEFIDQSNGTGNDNPEVKWLLGEDHSVYRSLKNPPAYGQPDKMSSSLYHRGDLLNLNNIPYDNGGVHTNSGINNKAVYLMSEGGTFNGFTVKGIGNDKVAEIYYEVQTHILTSGSNYRDLYFGLSQACFNVIGGKYEVTLADCGEVRKALDAVEMSKSLSGNFMKKAEVCPMNYVPNDLFYSGFEPGEVSWPKDNTSSDLSSYGRVKGYAATGDYSLHLLDIPGGMEWTSDLPIDLTVPTTGDLYLYFDHSFSFEYNPDNSGTWRTYDGGILRYELIPGYEWLDANNLLDSGMGYNGKIFEYPGDSNPLSNYPAFVKDSHGFVSSRYKLSTPALRGKTIRLSWVVGSDYYIGDLGWFIDNVRIYTCEPATPGISLFTDDFLTQKSWVNNSGGSISRDLSKYWLNWSVQQNKPAYYSIPIYATDDPVQLNFRFKVNNTGGDATLWIGLANELDKLSTAIAGNDLAGTFIGIDSSDKIQFLSRNADATYDQISSNDSKLRYEGTNAWRRGSLSISGRSWMFTLKDDGGNTLGQLSGELTEAQPYFNHLVLMYNGSGGTGNISGNLDDIQIFGNPDPVTDSISGTVVNAAGNPVAGIKMVDAYGHSALTDVNGHYFIGNLHTGKKVITPILSGDTFTPGSISLQPQAVTTGVDFVLNYRTPELTSLDTAHIVVGTDGINLTAYGKNFVQDSVVRWNGKDLPTTYVNSTSLKVPIEAADLSAIGTANVTVFNPTPGGGVSNSLTFTIAAPEKFLTPPVLALPVENGSTTSKTPTASVFPVTGAVKYQFQVSTDASFSNVISAITKTTTSFVIPSTAGLTYGSSYFWRARVIKADGYESAWSNANKFTVSLQSSPVNGGYTTSLLPKFAWIAMTGAKSYKLQISTSHDFTTDKVFERVQTTLGYSMATPLPGANIYYWRVGVQTAVSGEYLFMPEWKLIVSPTLPAKPTLSGPLTATLTNNNVPKLTWGIVSGSGNTYQVQISKSTSFAALIQSADLAEGTTEFTPSALPDTTYYWRVRTLNYLGAPSSWSTIWKFTVDTIAPLPPVLSSPAMNAIVAGTPTYSWNSSTGAKYYQFAYSSTTDCDTALFTSAEMSVRTFKPPIQAANQSYYWCVRARDAAGNLGGWSAPRKISIIPPKTVAPVSTSPGTYSTTSTPEFKWNPVPYGESYRIQVSTNPLFLLPTVDEVLDPGSTAFISSTLADGKYYWRVSAINLNGVQGAWSVVKSFIIDTIIPTIPTQTSPADGVTLLTRVPKFVVGAVTDAKYYQFQVDDDNNFTSAKVDKTLVYPYITLSSTQALTNGTWYWRVRTLDAAGNQSEWSSTRSFIVNIP